MVQPRHQEQKEGSRVEFECNISGETEARYQWFKDDSKIQGQRNPSLVLDNNNNNNNFIYVSIMKNSSNETTK